jgi:alpha-tubulin suppressor-like RCC1 family protein
MWLPRRSPTRSRLPSRLQVSLGGWCLLVACGSRTGIPSGAAPRAVADAGSGGAAGRGGDASAGRPAGGVATAGGGFAGSATSGGRSPLGGAFSGGESENPGSAGQPECPHAPGCPLELEKLALGSTHTCGLFTNGSVKCWGYGGRGRLGYGNEQNLGDDEPLSAIPALEVSSDPGVTVRALAAGSEHTCAVLGDGTVKCWGWNYYGQLGYGHTRNIGDDELPASAPAIALSEPAVDIAAGNAHTCAILESGRVQCWGNNDHGQLGYGHTQRIGDDEPASTVGPVSLQKDASPQIKKLVLGYAHTCALSTGDWVKCWGANAHGQLGYGNTVTIGDDELPSAVGASLVTQAVNVRVQDVAAGAFFTCAKLSLYTVRCWGLGDFGVLGYGNTDKIGDDEPPYAVDAGVRMSDDSNVHALTLAAGSYHVCARLSDDRLRCWGVNGSGQLGYGVDMPYIGDDELPASLPTFAASELPSERPVTLALGGGSSCLVTTRGARCWGFNRWGQLGLGHAEDVGDDEPVLSAPLLSF